MSIYSVDKLIEQARKLAADYREATGKTLPGISSEIAEHDAAILLKLELCADRSQGFDALGENGRRIQIKGRTIFDESKTSQRIGQIKVNQGWDCVVLVLLDERYEPFEIYQADREDLLEYIDRPSQAQKKRGALSVARFKIVGQRAWSRELGIEDELWGNRLDG